MRRLLPILTLALLAAGCGTAEPAQQSTPSSPATVNRGAAHPHGLTTTLTIPGLDQRLQPAQVWLPPQYFGAPAAQRFPVLLAMAPMHSTGKALDQAVKLSSLAEQTIAAGSTKPFILVLLPSRPRYDVDSECVDLPGVASQTFVTRQVTTEVAARFATLPLGQGWYTTGYSTGGQCAALLQARHPDLFTASVSVAGYFTPEYDAPGKRLATPELTAQNSPLELVKKRQLRRLDLLVVNATEDGASWGLPNHAPEKPDAQDFHRAARGLPGLDFLLFHGSRHAYVTYQPYWKPALEWLGKRGL